MIENALSKRNIDYENFRCSFCNDSNISLEKGSGKLMNGLMIY